ncbi:MAG TPA: type VI secretion system ATPase TssH, partial [Alphaproteobacteria bacterium]|nr:type VI secretion system ATPase TssH [Alphaproteobacteria bacterium]
MQSDKFTIKSQEAISAAQSLAREHGHNLIESTHLLAALLDQAEGSTVPVLQKLGLSVPALRQSVDQALKSLPKVSGATQVQLGQSAATALDAAFREADQLKDEYVSTEHILLAIAANEKDRAGKLLRDQGAAHDEILQALASVRGGARVTDPDPESKYQALEKYGRDLTAVARSGKLDPVVGRDEEIRRVIQVLSRRSKNNPVLI